MAVPNADLIFEGLDTFATVSLVSQVSCVHNFDLIAGWQNGYKILE